MTILVNCTRQIMTCEPIGVIYITLGTGNYVMKGKAGTRKCRAQLENC